MEPVFLKAATDCLTTLAPSSCVRTEPSDVYEWRSQTSQVIVASQLFSEEEPPELPQVPVPFSKTYTNR
ncbi:MAG: hypothetical protein JO235_07540 [Chroococcidiopsidaceae cyanobacterium CP_BM_RX_35]|nr:hypothetical protein [Chroococcidiopsidaceae cyanobacterium CP_BM_RX_35]